jgi:hypothetical protein
VLAVHAGLGSLVLREEARADGGDRRALDEGCLDRRPERSLDAQAERRAGSVELEGAERLLVEIAVLAA